MVESEHANLEASMSKFKEKRTAEIDNQVFEIQENKRCLEIKIKTIKVEIQKSLGDINIKEEENRKKIETIDFEIEKLNQNLSEYLEKTGHHCEMSLISFAESLNVS